MAEKGNYSPFLFAPSFISNPSESVPSTSSSPPPPSSRSDSSFTSPFKSSSRSPLSHASSSYFPLANFGPCAACEFHNRRCSDQCYIASFLPPDEVQNFAVVDSVFGSGNVVNFLQHNSNTSYTPLLLLLSREDEVDSDPTINTEDGSMELNAIEELIRGRELAEQLKLHLSSETSNMDSDDLSAGNLSGGLISQRHFNATHHPSKSPLYKEATSGSVNFFETFECSELHNGNSKNRKTLPIWADNVLVSTQDGLESSLNDGYRWDKHGQQDVLGAIYPSSYYRCIHKNTQNCRATRRVKRSDEDPNIFEISYKRLHTCYNGPQSPALLEKQNNMNGNNQQQQLQGTLFSI